MAKGDNMSTRNFKPVVSGENNVQFLKPAELADANLEGIFIESYEGKFGLNHKIETEAGETIIVNGFGMLNKKMEKVAKGSFIKLDYLGKKEIETGDMKGKLAHQVEVLIAE